MSTFDNVIDGIKMLSESVDNIKNIIASIKTGVDYVKRSHPDVSGDLIAMSQQMSDTLDALTMASSLVTRFSFTTAGSAVDNEPTRFNDFYRDNIGDENLLRQKIDSLRGHCHIIKTHAEALDQRASEKGLNSFLNLLNIRSSEKELELSDRLDQIYNEEMEIHLTVYTMAGVVHNAMEDVNNCLAGNPKNISQAAALLNEYRQPFSRLQSDCLSVADDIKRLILSLTD